MALAIDSGPDGLRGEKGRDLFPAGQPRETITYDTDRAASTP